jgi:hypothetical protein
MAEIYMSADSADGKRLSIAPITSTKLQRCEEIPSDTSGYFLTEECLSDPLGMIRILARIEDSEAAFDLGRRFAMS